ncbi:MAG: ABC transporter ATP-binding protein [Gemmatimonadales bacterium]|nr:ABC transporter ATP-binding protein [Gemmatimonadales bacterium]
MVAARDLVFTYPSSREPVVRGVSFEVGRGEIFGFLGPSGAGKSTIQRVLIGLLRGFAGSVRVLGRPVQDEGPKLYERIGVGFELPNHFVKLTAEENLRFFSSFYRGPTRAPAELLAMVGLGDDGGKRVDRFSKGMKMRLNFVRALLHDPEILFLDEPTAGLDPANARVLKDIVLEQKRAGKTIFLTTHSMHDAEELCDRVAFLVDGAIARTGVPRELRAEGASRRVTVEFRRAGPAQSAEFPLDGLGDDAAFLDLLRQTEVMSIHSHEPSLEDVFFRVAGRRLH